MSDAMWTHVDDHNEAVIQILEKGRIGETYLIGTGDEKNTLETIGLILKLMGKPADFIEHVKDRPGHDMRYAMDSSKIREELGWKPKFPTLEDGLKQTIDWYRDNPAWWQYQKAQVEAFYKSKGQ
jgi:dTDP-glucose 4,6-dehydratase